MRSPLAALSTALLLAAATAQKPMVTTDVVAGASSLHHLTYDNVSSYRAVQWSSYDRRSRGPEDPGWFTNADGFGREPIPGFAAVLREPGDDGVGLFLIGEVEGTGVIARTWTAGMGGTLRVYLDGSETPMFEGPASEFLARKTLYGLERARGAEPGPDEPGRWFVQEDADYLPILFDKGLRMTWEGRLDELHFYHVHLQLYDHTAFAQTFDWSDFPSAHTFRTSERFLTDEPRGGTVHFDAVQLEPNADQTLTHDATSEHGTTLAALRIRIKATDLVAALRGTLMQIAFDGCERPQVEAPVGDFFGSGPGVNPFHSLPMTVTADGTMTCRFPMPFHKSCAITFRNWSGVPVTVRCQRRLTDGGWSDVSLHFRARWRIDHDLTAEGGEHPIDLPYITLRGRGRFVGVACQIMNPTGIPTPWGSWWGEGDEKVLVDDEPHPVLFGTGSEDYFNYSWSRPDLFSYAFCGQPLDSGPGNSGFVSNHRFHVLDDVPFERFFAFAMELWTHTRVEGLSYGRIAYLYARPGVWDDHRALQPSDLRRPYLPEREPVASHGARDSVLHDAWDLVTSSDGAVAAVADEPLATRHRVLAWSAGTGETLRLRVPLPVAGAYDVHLVAVHRPDGAVLRASLDGEPLSVDGEDDALDLRAEHARRVLPRQLTTGSVAAGDHVLELRSDVAGEVGLDYLWIKLRHARLPNFHEAEEMKVVATSPGLSYQNQALQGAWSMGAHLWVRAQSVGDFVELATSAAPGRYRAALRLTDSLDYGVVTAQLNGATVAERVSTWSARLVPHAPIDLGEIEVGDGGVVLLRVELVDTEPTASQPKTFFGIDGLALVPVR